jgi:hypothetical protein
VRDRTSGSVFRSNVREGVEVHSPEMCFPLVEMSNIVQTLVENWFGSIPLLAPVYDLLFGTLFGRDSFVRTKFLNLTQALESLHRRTVGGQHVLRERLKGLLGGLEANTLQALDFTQTDDLVDLLVKTRNYLTHFDEKSKTTLVDDLVRMHYMNERLTALLFILILRRLGMNEPLAARGVLKRRHFQ